MEKKANVRKGREEDMNRERVESQEYGKFFNGEPPPASIIECKIVEVVEIRFAMKVGDDYISVIEFRTKDGEFIGRFIEF